MHVYKPPPVGGLDRVPVFTAGTGSTRADLFELDGVTPMPGNVLVADTSGNLPSFQCATSPVYVGVSGSRTTWQPSESGTPSPAASGASIGQPCWFGNQVGGTGLGADAVLAALTDGVAAGTDVIVHVADPTSLEVVTPGVFDIFVSLNFQPPNLAAAFLAEARINILTDELGSTRGPGYYPEWSISGDAAVDGNPKLNITMIGVPLAAGERLQMQDRGSTNVNWLLSTWVVVRRGDAPNP